LSASNNATLIDDDPAFSVSSGSSESAIAYFKPTRRDPA
jgi:hypothetical protein